ncbi:vWA domain-containing protein [Deinococcus aerophilus]|uniref:VWFA domain-containing protein n=1 Tax=Deinococcus aerophilus TaxID=522488 RepID=A0ABQ2GYI3_9DEIO|nr:VWA domain-containing protein [Deinococcus aerophilus]GGM18468.1 hypothetical protein GCM10010841_28210 [Deinococcus aerophilus]
MNPHLQVIPARPVADFDVTDLLIRVSPPAGKEGAPLDLVLSIDTSGSMYGLPLALAREAAAQTLPRLRPEDRVALVSFASGPVLHTPLQPVGDGRTLLTCLEALRASGSTALHAGWQLGAGLLLGARHPRRLASVLLLTDGKPNLGETRAPALADDLRDALTKGVSTSVVGAGLRYNEGLLERLADAGDGHFHHAEHPRELPALFQTELHHLQATVGRSATLRVEGVEVLDVLNDLPQSGYDLSLPPLRAAQELKLVLRVRVRGGQGMNIKLRWTDLNGKPQVQELDCVLPSLDGEPPAEHPEVVQERATLLAARAQRELAQQLDTGDVGRALDTLTLSRRRLLRAQTHGALIDRELLELEALEFRMARGEHRAASKQARSQAYSKSTGRR